MSRRATPASHPLTLAAAGCALALLACRPEPSPSGPAAPAPAEVPCAEGLVRTTDGCTPALPASPCPAGSMAVPGRADCVPVGWNDCGPGFARDEDGFGCRPVLPAKACGPYEIARLGSTDCRPLKDCAAPFPPAEATYFVDARYTTAQLDGFHFKSLADAYSAVPAGATIALEEGRYRFVWSLEKPITVIGRCPEKTFIADGAPRTPAVHVDAKGVAIDGVSVVDSDPGIAVERGGTLRLTRSVVAKNPNYNVYVFGQSLLQAEDVLVRDGVYGFDSGAGIGVYVARGSRAELKRVEVRNSVFTGVALEETFQATGVHSTVDAEDLVVSGTTTGPGTAISGVGLFVNNEARLTLRRSAILHNASCGLVASEPGTEATLDGVALRENGEAPVPNTGSDCGLLAQKGVKVSARRLDVSDNYGPAILLRGPDSTIALEEAAVLRARPPHDGLDRADGLNAGFGTRVTARSVAIVKALKVGVYVGLGGSSLDATGLLVRETRLAKSGFSRGVTVEYGTLKLSQAAVEDHSEIGLFVGGAQATATLSQVRVADIRGLASEQTIGTALMAREGGTLEVSASVLEHVRGVGLGMVGARGTATTTLLRDADFGLELQQGSSARVVDDLSVSPGPLELLLTRSLTLVDVASRTGTGDLPMPGAAGTN